MDTQEFPEAVKEPCNECPWRRDASVGHLGPHTAREWTRMAHSETAIACHKTIEGDDGWDGKKIRQCRGAAVFRANVCKTPRNPSVAKGPENHEAVFSNNEEFVNHHEPYDPWMGVEEFMREA